MSIPYNGGVNLIGDRLVTYEDGSIREIKKFLVLNDYNTILGCAGDTSLIESFFTQMTDCEGIDINNIYNSIRPNLKEVIDQFVAMNATSNVLYYNNIEILIVIYVNDSIELHHMRGLAGKRLNNNELNYIPENNSDVQRYTRINTLNFDLKKSTIFGEELLRQASFFNHKIGPPEYHGYDQIIITNEGLINYNNIPPYLNRIDPVEILEYITRFEIEEE